MIVKKNCICNQTKSIVVLNSFRLFSSSTSVRSKSLIFKSNSIFDKFSIALIREVEMKPKYEKYLKVLRVIKKEDLALMDSFLIALQSLKISIREKDKVCRHLLKISTINKSLIELETNQYHNESEEITLVFLASIYWGDACNEDPCEEDTCAKLSASRILEFYSNFYIGFIKGSNHGYNNLLFMMKLRRFLLFGKLKNKLAKSNLDFVNILSILKKEKSRKDYFFFMGPLMPIFLDIYDISCKDLEEIMSRPKSKIKSFEKDLIKDALDRRHATIIKYQGVKVDRERLDILRRHS